MPSEGSDREQEGGAGRHDSIRKVRWRGVNEVVDVMISGWREGEGVGLHDAIRRATERTQVNAVLHVVLLQLGQDVFSIRVLPQGGDVGPDL